MYKPRVDVFFPNANDIIPSIPSAYFFVNPQKVDRFDFFGIFFILRSFRISFSLNFWAEFYFMTKLYKNEFTLNTSIIH